MHPKLEGTHKESNQVMVRSWLLIHCPWFPHCQGLTLQVFQDLVLLCYSILPLYVHKCLCRDTNLTEL